MSQKVVIAVVDDDDVAREGMIDLVSAMGFTVDGYASASDFLKSSRPLPACLITDVRMPSIDGFALNERLREAGEAIPTILITSYPNSVDEARAARARALGYLAKPLDDEKLLQCIRSALMAQP